MHDDCQTLGSTYGSFFPMASGKTSGSHKQVIPLRIYMIFLVGIQVRMDSEAAHFIGCDRLLFILGSIGAFESLVS